MTGVLLNEMMVRFNGRTKVPRYTRGLRTPNPVMRRVMELEGCGSWRVLSRKVAVRLEKGVRRTACVGLALIVCLKAVEAHEYLTKHG